jgi:hypothetical protein
MPDLRYSVTSRPEPRRNFSWRPGKARNNSRSIGAKGPRATVCVTATESGTVSPFLIDAATILAARQPTHRAYSVIRREGQDDFWLNLGLPEYRRFARRSLTQ